MIRSAGQSYSYQGILDNLSRMNAAAEQIADPDSNAGVSEIVQLKQAQHGVEVNVAVLQRANETTRTLLDIIV